MTEILDLVRTETPVGIQRIRRIAVMNCVNSTVATYEAQHPTDSGIHERLKKLTATVIKGLDEGRRRIELQERHPGLHQELAILDLDKEDDRRVDEFTQALLTEMAGPSVDETDVLDDRHDGLTMRHYSLVLGTDRPDTDMSFRVTRTELAVDGHEGVYYSMVTNPSIQL